jgi:redox-sensing transcriptional repressor
MGYSVTELMARLRQILHLDREWPVVIIGAGLIGRALANYSGFAHRGFRVLGVFDNDNSKLGERVGEHAVRHIDELADFVRVQGVRVAMISVPAPFAQGVADSLVAAGIAAILNYAPVSLNVPISVRVENIDPVLHLQHMTYYLD